jgi:hypothetical protein
LKNASRRILPQNKSGLSRKCNPWWKPAREQCQRQELCIRCWIELQTTEPNWVIRKRISKLRLLMISVPLVQATWLTPTYPMKRIYFRHWYTWTIGRQSNLWRQYLRFIIMTKLGEYDRNPNGSAAVVRYRSNIGGSNLWFWNHVWLEFKPNFLNKKNFIWNVFSNIALTDSQYLNQMLLI